jgi:hypothetical protein
MPNECVVEGVLITGSFRGGEVLATEDKRIQRLSLPKKNSSRFHLCRWVRRKLPSAALQPLSGGAFLIEDISNKRPLGSQHVFNVLPLFSIVAEAVVDVGGGEYPQV